VQSWVGAARDVPVVAFVVSGAAWALATPTVPASSAAAHDAPMRCRIRFWVFIRMNIPFWTGMSVTY
jgi:hypothetical protein